MVATAREEQERRAPKLRAWLHTLFATLAPWAREHLGAERIAWLRTLVETYGGRGASLVAYGHIHRPYVRRLPALTVMNSGSVGLPYDGDWRAAYLLLEDRVPSIRRMAYDLERALDDLRAARYPLIAWQSEVQHQGLFTQPS
jgi:hypothetical protein